jgi:septal ring factor EnvC (AmiA/AmiB activator)
MHRARRYAVSSLLAISSITALGMSGMAGCVSSEAYDQMRREAESARLIAQNDQRRTHELSLTNKKMKQQIEELEATLKETQEKLARTDREWRETRDELLRIKIEREQRRGAVRGQSALAEGIKPPAESPQEPTRKPVPNSEEVKRRLHGLLEQLQAVLEQF